MLEIGTMRVPEEDLRCQCILSIFPAGTHQFYANILALNINLFLYINDQFALVYKAPTAASVGESAEELKLQLCSFPATLVWTLLTAENVCFFAISTYNSYSSREGSIRKGFGSRFLPR